MRENNATRRSPVYGYVRVSPTENADHKNALRQQENDLREFCINEGIELAKGFAN